MRVKHLTDLLTWNEIWMCQDVFWAREGNKFGPIRTCLRDERTSCGEDAYGKPYVVNWFSAKARYAEELLRRAEATVCAATGAEPERVEWVAATESFNTVMWPNLDADAYVRDVMREMERLADSGCVIVRTGIRSLEMVKSSSGQEKERLEIVLPEQHKKGKWPQLKEVLKPGALEERDFTFRWTEVSDVFAVLSPMQIAFLHEKNLHRHTPLDDELLEACSAKDEERILAALGKGANIHALGEYGESVCSNLVAVFSLWGSERSDDDAHNPARAEHLLGLLLEHGADVDLVGACEMSALSYSAYCASWMTELLLRSGADPDGPSWISAGEKPETLLTRLQDEKWFLREYEKTPNDQDGPDLFRSERLLFRAGGGDVVMRDSAVKWFLENIDLSTDSGVEAWGAGLTDIQRHLFGAAREQDERGVLAAVKSGARLDGKDAFGRNLVQIAVDYAPDMWLKNSWKNEEAFHRDLTNFVLFLLGHMKMPMGTDDWRCLAEKCKTLGETELLEEALESPLFGEQFRAALGKAKSVGWVAKRRGQLAEWLRSEGQYHVFRLPRGVEEARYVVVDSWNYGRPTAERAARFLELLKSRLLPGESMELHRGWVTVTGPDGEGHVQVGWEGNGKHSRFTADFREPECPILELGRSSIRLATQTRSKRSLVAAGMEHPSVVELVPDPAERYTLLHFANRKLWKRLPRALVEELQTTMAAEKNASDRRIAQ
jgi:hypothetical protein